MRNYLFIVGLLLLFNCLFLISCANDEVTINGCRAKQYKGVLIIDDIYSKFDGRHNQRTIYGTFIPDVPDAPKELRQAKLKKELGYPETRDFSTNEKYRVKVGYAISGDCPEKLILESSENWKDAN
ncbi:MAG: hypothetical protein K1X72_01435 [Pyrinomonadaceae bacterium]|nr:hypothetical protein [Pyrinomonadaceae bacterium]